MAYAVTGLIGANLDGVIKTTDLTGDQKVQLDNALGQQVWGNDGRLYVYAKATATIAANVTVAAVDPATFEAVASGGAYSPPAAMVDGDYGWFSKASV